MFVSLHLLFVCFCLKNQSPRYIKRWTAGTLRINYTVCRTHTHLLCSSNMQAQRLSHTVVFYLVLKRRISVQQPRGLGPFVQVRTITGVPFKYFPEQVTMISGQRIFYFQLSLKKAIRFINKQGENDANNNTGIFCCPIKTKHNLNKMQCNLLVFLFLTFKYMLLLRHQVLYYQVS